MIGAGGGRLKHLGLPTESDQTDLNKLTSKKPWASKIHGFFYYKRPWVLILTASCISKERILGMRIQQFPSKEQFVKLAADKNVVPVCIEILADTETPVSLLKKIRNHQKSVFLLESVEGGERWGRYSFLGASARTHIRVYSDVVKIMENGHETSIDHEGNPFCD
jgi:hypothetical protein